MKNVSSPEFWDQRYVDNNTKWDLGGPTPILSHFLQTNHTKGKACVLGCGNGHDAIELSNYDLSVYAVDFSIHAINNLRKKINQRKSINLLHRDIFTLSEDYSDTFDIVFEYTCYCAINPDRREDYFNMVHKILKRGGKLLGIFIPLDKDIYNEDGPPFGVSVDEIITLANGKFKILENTFSEHSIDKRAGREKWMILEKI